MRNRLPEFCSLLRRWPAWCLVGAFCAAFTAGAMAGSVALAQEDEGPTDGQLAVDRAWDYRPYRVRVWICSDRSPAVNANLDRLTRELQRRAELADPSGWELLIGRAPSPWNYRFRQYLEQTERLKIKSDPVPPPAKNDDGETEEAEPVPPPQPGFSEHPQLRFDDKLMIVCLESFNGFIRCRVREFDLLTHQWSAVVKRDIAHSSQLEATVFDLVTTAFMPIARIDRIDSSDNVFLHVRAVNVCRRVTLDEDGNWVLTENTGSPCWVRDNDIFLPVIRKTDRSGEISFLEPIDFTFLTINRLEGAEVETSIQSYHRAPLAGRTSKRAQKLALVIRPPDESTTLKFVSRDDDTYPMEGFEVLSKPVGAPKDQQSQPIGVSDWRGEVTIPPSENGLRILLVKRGNRGLMRLPVMPGLYDQLQTAVPNDETRLNAQGIISGVNTEIVNLVALRQIYVDRIEKALENGDVDKAEEVMELYQSLPSVDSIRSRMASDEARLKSETTDPRETDFIARMFTSLREILAGEVANSRETELLQAIQKATAP